MSTFWMYCHAEDCQTEVECDLREAWRFIVEHSYHAPLITRILREQLDQWEADLVTEAATYLQEGKS